MALKRLRKSTIESNLKTHADRVLRQIEMHDPKRPNAKTPRNAAL